MTDQVTPFESDLRQLINRYSIENESDTPDFILAQYISGCLDAFKSAVRNRDRWYGHNGLSTKVRTEIEQE